MNGALLGTAPLPLTKRTIGSPAGPESHGEDPAPRRTSRRPPAERAPGGPRAPGGRWGSGGLVARLIDTSAYEDQRATMTLGMVAKQLGEWCDQQTGIEGSSGVSYSEQAEHPNLATVLRKQHKWNRGLFHTLPEQLTRLLLLPTSVRSLICYDTLRIRLDERRIPVERGDVEGRR